MKKFNAFQIKLFMIFLMVLDHLSIIPNFLPFEVIAVFHLISRPVALWFTFMLVEGFIYTHNRYRYCIRLFTFAIFMMIGSSILNIGFLIPISPLYPNIIFALAMSCTILILNYHHDETIDKVPPVFRKILAIIVFIICFLLAEGSFIVPMFTLIFYKTYDNTKHRNIWLISLTLIMLMLNINVLLTITSFNIFMLFYSEWFFISVIPFIKIYNGERGLNTKFSKYLFYVFYPLHIWILYIIASLV